MFEGQHIPPEIMEDYNAEEILPYLYSVFLPLIDRETGSFLHFPFPGSLMEQPALTMDLLHLFQSEFFKSKQEQMKKHNR